jgi:hypothetical protein
LKNCIVYFIQNSTEDVTKHWHIYFMQSSTEDVGETAYYSIQNSTERFLKNICFKWIMYRGTKPKQKIET